MTTNNISKEMETWYIQGQTFRRCKTNKCHTALYEPAVAKKGETPASLPLKDQMVADM